MDIKKLFLSNQNLFRNTSFLTLTHFSNYILSFITIPILARVLGVEMFGVLASSIVLTNMFLMLVDFGFNLTATRDIARHKNNVFKEIEIFSHVYVIKVILFILAVLLTLLCISFVDFINEYWELYALSLGIVLGHALMPVWLFLGHEDMKYVAYFNLTIKLFFAILLVLLVNDKEDINLVPIINSAGYLIVGISSFIYAIKKYQLHFSSVKFILLKKYLLDGSYLFLSNIVGMVYSSSYIILLGFYTNPASIGFYAAAQKLIRPIAAISLPFTQSLFPIISGKFHNDSLSGMKTIKNFTFFGSLIMLLTGLITFFLAKPIILIIFGEEFLSSVILLQVMSLIPLFRFINDQVISIYINLDLEKYVLAFVSINSCISLAAFFLLAPSFLELGASISLSISYAAFSMIPILLLLFKKPFLRRGKNNIS